LKDVEDGLEDPPKIVWVMELPCPLVAGIGRFFGGAGNERLSGGEGEDEIHGGEGDDIDLDGDNLIDEMYGEEGNDLEVDGDRGRVEDVIHCGLGLDTIVSYDRNSTYWRTVRRWGRLIVRADRI
jgi:Ca2+-binding RTX toxin-like protein